MKIDITFLYTQGFLITRFVSGQCFFCRVEREGNNLLILERFGGTFLENVMNVCELHFLKWGSGKINKLLPSGADIIKKH